MVAHVALDSYVGAGLAEVLPRVLDRGVLDAAIRADVLLLLADVEEVVEQFEHRKSLDVLLGLVLVGFLPASVLQGVLLELLDHHFGAELLAGEHVFRLVAVRVRTPPVRRILPRLDGLLAGLANNGHAARALLQFEGNAAALLALEAVEHDAKGVVDVLTVFERVEVKLLALEHLALDLLVGDVEVDASFDGQFLLPVFIHFIIL